MYFKKSALSTLLATAMLSAGLMSNTAQAQETKPFRIGAMVDMSGIYSALGGPGMVNVLKMAAEDFGGKVTWVARSRSCLPIIRTKLISRRRARVNGMTRTM